jgi:hypothetical protein
MRVLKKAHAEAVTKLTRVQRQLWVERGMHVVRRPGRRWTAALTPRQIAAANDQVATVQQRWQQLPTARDPELGRMAPPE